LKPPPEVFERSLNLKKTKLAALIAHGTNLGLSTMGNSTDAVTVEMLQNVSRHYLTEITLKEANNRLVNYHHGLSMSGIWGDGGTSSSDGQRFGVQASSLIASYYPRYARLLRQSIDGLYPYFQSTQCFFLASNILRTA